MHHVHCSIFCIKINGGIWNNSRAIYFHYTIMFQCPIQQYIEIKSNVFVFCIWPAAKGKEAKIHSIFSEYGSILYQKNVRFTPCGRHLFLVHAFYGHPWIGDWSSHFSGAISKESEFFPSSNPLRCFWLEATSLEKAQAAEKRICDLFGVGGRAVYCSVSRAETFWLSKILLNQNTIDFFNYANPFGFPQFATLFEAFRNSWQELSTIEQDLCCLDSSAVLAIHGIRDTRDFDYLTTLESTPLSCDPFTENNRENIVHYSEPIDGLIHNPCNHFYFLGIKFVTLSNVLKMKTHRGEECDLQDVALAEIFLQACSPKSLIGLISGPTFLNTQRLRVFIWTIAMRIRSRLVQLKNYLISIRNSFHRILHHYYRP